MLKCHNLLARLFQNGTGGHQVISKNQAPARDLLPCANLCPQPDRDLSVTERSPGPQSPGVNTPPACAACVPVTPDSKTRCFCHVFVLVPAALIARNALRIHRLYHSRHFSTLVQSVFRRLYLSSCWSIINTTQHL